MPVPQVIRPCSDAARTMTHTELDTLIEEATIDCYTEHEQITGLFTMVDEHLALPFDTELLGVTVTVTKVDLTIDQEIIAICRRGTHMQTIPILDLPVPTPHRTARNGSRPTAAGAARRHTIIRSPAGPPTYEHAAPPIDCA
jgi:hypothetical protein